LVSLLLKQADLGLTGHGCYRTRDYDGCGEKRVLVWFWHRIWICDTCVLNSLLPQTGEYGHSRSGPENTAQANMTTLAVEAEAVRIRGAKN
jgi:hypothetical protein